MRDKLASIVSRFRFDGTFAAAEPITSGHINDTYVVRFDRQHHPPRRYLLQRINTHVFPDPERLMDNFAAVTAHLRQRIRAAGGDPARRTITPIPTVGGESFLRTPTGEYWRAAVFVDGTRVLDKAASLDQAHQVATAFGQFLSWMADFPAGRLHEPIPHFHDTPRRFLALVAATERDSVDRASMAQSEIAFAEQRAAELSTLIDLLEADRLPLRVTHNDTKLDNVLLDELTGQGLCVIDLDTVMPGLVHYDFGDLVRSAASSAVEDETDLSRVSFDLQVFSHLVAGYLASAGNILTPLELDYLAFSARLLTLECGIRFLTDFLDGDRYFRTHRPHHNLDRCRTQFHITHHMELQFEQMLEIVEQHRVGWTPAA